MKDTRMCIKCLEDFEGTGVMVFRVDDGGRLRRSRNQLMCLACGTEKYLANHLPEFNYAGSVSTGTLKGADLLAAFLPVLKDLNETRYDEIMATPDSAYEFPNNDRVDEVMTALEEAAPIGYTFGTLGGGADFGFWEIES